jgi:hypothetical protein
MKKNLLSLFMLMLCIGFFSAGTFAQDAPGTGGSEGYYDVETGIAIGNVQFTKPNFVLHVTRNNGNGTTATGKAQTRLHVSDKGQISEVKLMSIAWQDDKALKNKVVDRYTDAETFKQGYFSFPLLNNIPPKGKLVFEFLINGVTYHIPETIN